MKEIDINSRIYSTIIPEILELLLDKNEMTTLFKECELGTYEKAMVNRLFGKQLCEIIAQEGQMKPQEAVKMVERTFECNSKVVKFRGNEMKKYAPRGLTSYSLVQNTTNHKYGKHFSPKILSSNIMKPLERWGFVESFKSKGSLNMFRINGYKRDYLCSCQVSHF